MRRSSTLRAPSSSSSARQALRVRDEDEAREEARRTSRDALLLVLEVEIDERAERREEGGAEDTAEGLGGGARGGEHRVEDHVGQVEDDVAVSSRGGESELLLKSGGREGKDGRERTGP